MHFVIPETYAKIVPPYLPAPMTLVYISGACEIAGGVGVFLPKFRQAAGWGLVALLIAVFPANVYMATAHMVHPVLAWGRLPLQAVLIWWVLRVTR